MEKLDLKKKYKEFYKPTSRKVTMVEVPKFDFIMVDGEVPAGMAVNEAPGFLDAIGALYGMSYTLKFMSKQREENSIDYGVMALEGLWWTDDPEIPFSVNPGVRMHFTAMMMQPDHISAEMFEQAKEDLREKKNPPMLDEVRFEPFHEGLSMQIMHVGPYAEEPATLEKMEAFAEENGYVTHGKHHEIYLGDPRRAKPENLKTVLRQPIKKK